MKQSQPFTFSAGVIAYPLLSVFLLWVVYWFEIRFDFDFTKMGVYPRILSGLKGIVLNPFIHSSIKHLYNNSLPLLVLLAALLYFYRPISWKIVFYGIVFSGFLTWLIARDAYHIGASGLIYVLVSFIFFKGIFAKHFRLIALSLLIVFIYGGLLWYLFPIEDRISWEGHLSGFITGFLLALFFKSHVPKPKRYDWEEENYDEENDPFLKHFDEDGNFIE